MSLPDLHFGLAKVYRRLGQLDKAIAAARQSIRLLPENPVAHRLLARLYQDAGQSESARQALESYRELKACKALMSEHVAQVLGYLPASGHRDAMLINFGSSRLEIKKFVL